jgi:23S rRNA (adenine2503-C2)-methyltransferase
MSNLPARLRTRLEAEAPLSTPTLLKRQISRDGTRKYLFRLADDALIETVAIPQSGRLTVCFSTQVGCAMGCAFCTTGASGLTRSLAPGEMVDQLIALSEDFGQRVTNAVAMGEGEPFANYDATLAALRIINSPDGLGIGARHLVISSCGLLGPLRRFIGEPEQFTLAISLHSAIQTTRDALMPALATQPLDILRATLVTYGETTGRRPSLEVALIAGVNDTPPEVEALISFARGMLCHINIIPLNTQALLEGEASSGRQASSPERCAEVVSQLQAAGIECSLRRSRGSDIQGACGQLKGGV